MASLAMTVTGERRCEKINILTQRRQGAKARQGKLLCFLCAPCDFAPWREMLLLVEEVIVNADGEQHILLVALRLLHFPDLFFEAPCERAGCAKSQRAQLGGKSNGVVNKSPALGLT